MDSSNKEVDNINMIDDNLSLFIETSFDHRESDNALSSDKALANQKAKAQKFIDSSIAFYNKINYSSKSEKEKIDSLQVFMEFLRKFLRIIQQKQQLKEFKEPIESLVTKLKGTILSEKVALIKRLNFQPKEEKENFISSLITKEAHSNDISAYCDYSNKMSAMLGIWDKAGKSSFKCLLLYGPKGNGKKLLAKCLSIEAKSFFLNLNCKDLFVHIENFPVLLLKISLGRPIVIFIPDLEDYNKHKEKLIFIIEKITETKTSQILIVGSTTQPDNIDFELRKYFVTGEYVGPFSKTGKSLYVQSLLNGYKHNITEEQFKEMGQKCLTYSNGELKKLIQSVIIKKTNPNAFITYQQIIDNMVYYPGSITAEVLIKLKNFKI